MTNSPEQALAEARRIAGGSANLARAMGIRKQAVSQWTQVPWNRVLKVEELTRVPRHDLRPDIYPPCEEHQPRAVPTIQRPTRAPRLKTRVVGMLAK